MKVIWKFKISRGPGVQKIEVPAGPEWVKVRLTDQNEIEIWGIVNPDNDTVRIPVAIFGTGEPFDPRSKHVGTVFHGPDVWHVMEV
jgi:hypothetical protein